MEAAIGVPVFICSMAVILIMGQMIFTQAQIYYALSQTTQMYAQVESVKVQGDTARNVETYALFFSYLGRNQIYENCLKGGRRGILLRTEKTDSEVIVSAHYYLKVSVPYFKSLGFLTEKTCRQRIFSGYVVHEGSGEETDPVVYLAENASVYHTTMACSHISIRIKDPGTIRGIIGAGTHSPCRKCIKSGIQYTEIYITAQGDSYHSTLSCSALKRTVRAVRLSETGGMRACSRCGKK